MKYKLISESKIYHEMFYWEQLADCKKAVDAWGLTYQQIAKESGVSYSTVQRFFKGQNKNRNIIKAMQDIHGCTLDGCKSINIAKREAESLGVELKDVLYY